MELPPVTPLSSSPERADLPWIRVDGESMSPFLQPGSFVGVEWLDATKAGVRAGDLVLCREASGDWILHRLLAREGSRSLVKGDAGFLAETFEANEVWGKAVSIRSPGDPAARPFARGWLDVLIARISLASLRSGNHSARWLRKSTRALSWLRRWL